MTRRSESVRSAIAQELNAPGWRRLAIAAPPGAGVGGVIEDTIVEATERGELVLVLAAARELTEQWASRLSHRRVPVIPLHGGSAFLVAAEQDPRAFDGHALVMTGAMLVAKARVAQFAAIRPDLLVVDHVTTRVDNRVGVEVRALMERTARVVWWERVVPGPAEAALFDRAFRVGFTDLLRESGHTPRLVVIAEDADGALQALRERTASILGWPEIVPLTLAEVHDELVREYARLEEARSSGPRIESDELTRTIGEVSALLDKIESLPDDPRVDALVRIVNSRLGKGRAVLISTSRLSDAEYVAAGLASAGVRAGVVNSASDWAARREVLRDFGQGRVMVQGLSRASAIHLPSRTTHILWSAPEDGTLARDVAQAVVSEDAEIVTFSRDVADRVCGLLRDDGPRLEGVLTSD